MALCLTDLYMAVLATVAVYEALDSPPTILSRGRVLGVSLTDNYFRNWQIATNLRGNLIEGSRLCQPVSGNVSMEVRTNATTGSVSTIEVTSTTISKEVDDQYWRVVVEISVESPFTGIEEIGGSEYFARSLQAVLLDVNTNSGIGGEDSVREDANFICDMVELP